ncbi:hypothetical protein [Archangium minus]|uniref:hypothetical protein n=1 Tax=Archangium minus TaxID=83450 RepID=UPI0037C0023A
MRGPRASFGTREAFALPQAGAEEANEAPQAAASKEPLKERTHIVGVINDFIETYAEA